MAHIRSLFFDGPLADVENKAMEALERGRPSEVIWNITNACNLLCEHCYINATYRRARRELADGEALALAARIGELGVPLLFITGGEPLLRGAIWEILATAREHGTRTVVSTNATLIDTDTAGLLKAHGVDYVAISLYGPETFHDGYVRVPGAYQRIVSAISDLNAVGVGVCIKTTVNRATWPRIHKIIQIAKDLGARLFYPCDLITAGRSKGASDQRVRPAEWRRLADFMLDDVLANPEGIEYDIGAMPSVAPYLAQRLIERGHDVTKALDRLATMSACPVGRGLMNITAEGDILPCSFAQDYRIGNVREMDLAKAARTLFAIGHVDVGGACGDCDFSRICRGCRTKAWHACGDIQGEDPTCLINEPAA